MRKIIFIFIFQGLFACVAYTQQVEKPLRIGLIADPQYADKADGKTRFYRNSLQKLDDAVQGMNTSMLDLTVVLGDMVDEGPKDAKPIIDRLKKLTMPFYLILGNHDYPKEYQADVFKQFGMPHEYYSIDKGNWILLFLNTNELSSYATERGSALSQEYLDLSAQPENLGRTHLKPWNGGVSKKQMNWIVKQLDRADKQAKQVLVFTHHPLYPEIGYEVLNNRQLLDLLVKHTVVKAVISGHNHAGNFTLYQDLPCITLEGMIETEDQNAFGQLELSSDKLFIQGVGRMTSRILNLR